MDVFVGPWGDRALALWLLRSTPVVHQASHRWDMRKWKQMYVFTQCLFRLLRDRRLHDDERWPDVLNGTPVVTEDDIADQRARTEVSFLSLCPGEDPPRIDPSLTEEEHPWDPEHHAKAQRLAVTGPVRILYHVEDGGDRGPVCTFAPRPPDPSVLPICVSTSIVWFNHESLYDTQQYDIGNPQRALDQLTRICLHIVTQWRRHGVQIPVLPALGCLRLQAGLPRDDAICRLYAQALARVLTTPHWGAGAFRFVVLALPQTSTYDPMPVFEEVLRAHDTRLVCPVVLTNAHEHLALALTVTNKLHLRPGIVNQCGGGLSMRTGCLGGPWWDDTRGNREDAPEEIVAVQTTLPAVYFDLVPTLYQRIRVLQLCEG